jgi:hypothetical protein
MSTEDRLVFERVFSDAVWREHMAVKPSLRVEAWHSVAVTLIEVAVCSRTDVDPVEEALQDRCQGLSVPVRVAPPGGVVDRRGQRLVEVGFGWTMVPRLPRADAIRLAVAAMDLLWACVDATAREMEKESK